MLQGRGNTGGQVVCPLHRWTYGLDGQLRARRTSSRIPACTCATTRCSSGTACCSRPAARRVADELRALGTAGELDFSGYVFDRAVVHECDYNWKTFIEVYLEDYHVGPFHPGLGNLVTCDDLRWEFGEQSLGADRRPETPAGPAGLARLRALPRRAAALAERPRRRPRARSG